MSIRRSSLLPARHDLTTQVILLYALLVVPLVIALLTLSTTISNRVQADVQATDLALANAVASETNTAISDMLQMVENLSRYDAVRRADPQDMRALFETVSSARPSINLIYRLDAQGVMVYHFPIGVAPTIGKSFAFREYFQRARETHYPLVSMGRISPTTGEPVATALMPIWTAEEEFNGVVAVNMRLTDLSQTITSIAEKYDPQSGFEIMILDARGQIIAHPNPDYLLHSASDILPDIYQPVLHGKSGSQIAFGLDNTRRLYTYAPINRAGWGVIISRPTSVAFTTASTIRRISLASIVTFLLVGVLFWVFLNRRVIRPLEKLAEVSNLIGTEESLPPQDVQQLQQYARYNDQVGQLIKSLLRAETALSARVREQTMLLETSTIVISTLDLDTVLDRILEQVQRLLQVKMCALVAREETSDRFRIRASRGLSERFSRQLVISPNEPDSPTMRAIRSRQPIQISDTESDPSFILRRPRARAEGFRSMLVVPLNTKHTPPSALLVFHPEPHIFTPSEIRLLSSFGNQAAMALENAALYARSDARLQEQTRRLEALASSLKDGLILSDWRGEVVYANRRTLELADLDAEDLPGISVDTILTRLIQKSPDPVQTRQRISEALKRYTKRTTEFALQHNDRLIYLSLQVFDVTDHQGVPIGQGQLLRDITLEREVDRMKSNLISTVSHELRTPLAAIKGYASTLLAEDVVWDEKSQREFLRIISDEADRLSQLVTNLLDLSRLEAGRLRLQKREVNISQLIRQAFQNASKEPETSLEIDLAPDLPPVYADPLRLETILRNLIENGAKYAGPLAHITVRVSHTRRRILFRVEDNGPGIPPEEMPHIFKHFYRIEGHQTVRGTGLGLAICEGLVRAHNGEIWVEPLENGTCFAFTLPLREETS